MALPLRILVIDSEPNCAGLGEALEMLGLSASITISSSAGAVAHITETLPDLVLLEIVMPDSDGIELLYFIKHDHPATRVIAMSAGGACLPRDVVLYWANRLGADAVLPKPFDIARLARALHQALSGRRRVNAIQAAHP
jgi:CheY-like chemotaxis protein